MRIISIKFDDCLANWSTSCAQKNRITISVFIRDLLYEKMQQGSVVLNYPKKPKQSSCYTQTGRSEMGYIIFTAKLLEKFVLATQEQGEILRNLAFEETENLLAQLRFNNKGQRFSIRLEDLLFIWLKNEAARLQLKLIPLIRKLIEISFTQSDSTIVIGIQLSPIQKIAIEHQIISCKLLEKLVNQTIDDGLNIVEEVRSKTNNILLKLFPKQSLENGKQSYQIF